MKSRFVSGAVGRGVPVSDVQVGWKPLHGAGAQSASEMSSSVADAAVLGVHGAGASSLWWSWWRASSTRRRHANISTKSTRYYQMGCGTKLRRAPTGVQGRAAPVIATARVAMTSGVLGATVQRAASGPDRGDDQGLGRERSDKPSCAELTDAGIQDEQQDRQGAASNTEQPEVSMIFRRPAMSR